mmetsp:Transcript_37248/g.95118  ORF Transcript_37248/g.95118 Transcript_37248/m.95118 type:complete len:246 (-) Transcript_37248:441-1178(-)
MQCLIFFFIFWLPKSSGHVNFSFLGGCALKMCSINCRPPASDAFLMASSSGLRSSMTVHASWVSCSAFISAMRFSALSSARRSPSSRASLLDLARLLVLSPSSSAPPGAATPPARAHSCFSCASGTHGVATERTLTIRRMRASSKQCLPFHRPQTHAACALLEISPSGSQARSHFLASARRMDMVSWTLDWKSRSCLTRLDCFSHLKRSSDAFIACSLHLRLASMEKKDALHDLCASCSVLKFDG